MSHDAHVVPYAGSRSPCAYIVSIRSLLKAKIENGVSLVSSSDATHVTNFAYLGPCFGELLAEYEPIRISDVWDSGNRSSRTRAAFVNHGKPGAWLSTTVACANGAEFFDWLLGALDWHDGHDRS